MIRKNRKRCMNCIYWKQTLPEWRANNYIKNGVMGMCIAKTLGNKLTGIIMISEYIRSWSKKLRYCDIYEKK